MKKNKTEISPELEALGREAVESLHLSGDMRLEPERFRQITEGRPGKNMVILPWTGVACALLILWGAFLPSLSGSGKNINSSWAMAEDVRFDGACADDMEMEVDFFTASSPAAAPEVAYGAVGGNRAQKSLKRRTDNRKAMVAKNVAAASAPALNSVTAMEESGVAVESAIAVQGIAADRVLAMVAETAAGNMRNGAAVMNRPAGKTEGFTDPAEEPFSTFSIDSDRGSFQHACQLLREGVIPLPEDIRIEQFVNSPEYTSYPQPGKDEVLKPFLSLAVHPFRPGRHILRAAIQGGGSGGGSAGNDAQFVIITDESGSMAIGNAAAEARIFRDDFLAENSNVKEVVPVSDAFAQIWNIIDRCTAMARNKNIVVILVSDLRWIPEKKGRENLLEMIRQARSKGVRLNVIAFGASGKDPVADEYDISTDQWAEALCEAGGGIYLRADNGKEAMEMLGSEMQGRFQVIADDVKIQVEFDPAAVAGYRLLGYERRMMEAEDFRNDQVRAAPLLDGGQVTAVYELIMQPGYTSGRAAVMNVRYREPGGLGFAERKCEINAEDAIDIESDADFKAAAVIAEWARGLRYGDSTESVGTDLLLKNVPEGDNGRFAEYMELIRASR